MYILVKTITGVSNIFENIENFSELQTNISEKMGIPVDEQTLLFQNQILDDFIFDMLNDYAEVQLKISLEGGAKKKKKKEVKKTKKKHVHKKVNLAVFKHYKVENGKVIRLRQMCKVCPPGTFLAEHENRLYCGRCRTAYSKIVDNAKGGKGKGDKGKGGEKGQKKEKAAKKEKK